MATALKNGKAIPPNPYEPTDWDKYQAEKEERAAVREAKRPVLRACLDPEEAAVLEAAKPRFKFKVRGLWDARSEKTGKLESQEKTLQVNAQCENDAFAAFCDRIQHWPGRKGFAELTIEKVTQLGNVAAE